MARILTDPDKPGLPARDAAARMLHKVLTGRRGLDEEAALIGAALPEDDRALARAIATTSFRGYGTIRHALDSRIQSGWPPDAGLLQPILITAVAQILFMDAADHAAVDLAVTLIHQDSRARRYSKLANAVLRRIAREAPEILAARDASPRLDLPEWLTARWERAYGPEETDRISRSLRFLPAIDVTLNPTVPFDAGRLPHFLLPTGSLRLTTQDRIETLPGYEEGAFFVQDAAAAIPAKLLGARPGERVLDLCAAPGGKTAQLAATGAQVVAVDRSAARLEWVRENLARLRLSAGIIAADGATVSLEPFDRILIDAPCSATGTIRRHPELPWTRSLEDIAKLTRLQARLLDHAAGLLRPGGTLVYATCSLEWEEGEAQIAAFLTRQPEFKRSLIAWDEVGGLAEVITDAGELRMCPHHLQLHSLEYQAHRSGTDGFFAARLTRG